ncbi:hypothetical protein [Streptomyces sp. CA-146814]|uniref:hypothetical protein n=1 Tax=Streptomyces sp. CA-146814 TaxID=3240053 RepID=UPI003D8EBA56
MISARIRYTLTLCLAVASGAASIAFWVASSWRGGLSFWLVTIVCVVACGRMRTTAALLQQAHQAARVAAFQAELLAGQHCGHEPSEVFTWLQPGQYGECVLPPGHPGSHADENETRWWIDTATPPTTKETPTP